jgi:amino-acid N-acetyltransferase
VLRVEIEALLSQGLPNSPMAGAQIASRRATTSPRGPIGVVKGTDFLFTGAVRKVDAAGIARRLDAGEVALVPPLGYSPTGECSTWRGRTSRRGVAVALRADKLLMYTDRLPADAKGEVIAELTAQEADSLLSKKYDLSPDDETGNGARRSGRQGRVARSHIVTRRASGSLLLELFTHTGVGTMITAATVEKLRPARIEDVQGMLALIEPLEAEGTLVKRSRELLEAEIGNFLVVEHDGVIVGCAALYPFKEEKSAEFACPRGRRRLSRRRLRRGPAESLRGARPEPAHPAPVRAHHARRALVPRAGLPRRRRGQAALAPPGALQLEARLEGVPQAPIILVWQEQ